MTPVSVIQAGRSAIMSWGLQAWRALAAAIVETRKKQGIGTRGASLTAIAGMEKLLERTEVRCGKSRR